MEDIHWATYTLFHGVCTLVSSCVLLYFIPRITQYLWELSFTLSVDRTGFSNLNLPPGSMGYPLIGETISFIRKGGAFFKEKMMKHGNIYKTHMLGNPTVRVIGAENIKQILLGENTLVTQNWPTSTRILLGAGSISQSSGNEHRVRRKHMLHAFKKETLQEFLPVLQELVRESVQSWIDSKDIYAYHECKRMAFLFSSRLLIGIGPDSTFKDELQVTFTDLLHNLMTLPIDIPGFGFRKGLKAKRKIIEHLSKILLQTKKNPYYTPVMHAYHDSSEKLGTSADDIYEGVIDLLFAGHETIASATTNGVMFLGQNERVVEKLRQELCEHGLENSSDCDLTYDRLRDLKYLNGVFKEILRLCPPAGGGFRKALKSFELGGYLIPKGWTVIYSIRETQHTSDIFVDSETFDPDRWTDQSLDSDTSRFHFIPFGAGARGCIGKTYAELAVKVFLIELVRNADWTLKNSNPEIRYIPIPVATDHLPTSFRARAENCGGNVS